MIAVPGKLRKFVVSSFSYANGSSGWQKNGHRQTFMTTHKRATIRSLHACCFAVRISGVRSAVRREHTAGCGGCLIADGHQSCSHKASNQWKCPPFTAPGTTRWPFNWAPSLSGDPAKFYFSEALFTSKWQMKSGSHQWNRQSQGTSHSNAPSSRTKNSEREAEEAKFTEALRNIPPPLSPGSCLKSQPCQPHSQNVFVRRKEGCFQIVLLSSLWWEGSGGLHSVHYEILWNNESEKSTSP